MKLTRTLRQAFVRAVIGDVPKIDYLTQACDTAMKFGVAGLPGDVKAIYKVAPEFIAIQKAYVSHLGYVYFPGKDNLTDKQQAELDQLSDKAAAQREAHRELEEKLIGVANSVQTVKALKELLPEFAKYMPDETGSTMNLPAIAIANVVADFVKAGWPDKQKAVAAA